MAVIRASDMTEDYEDKPVAEGMYELKIVKADWGPTSKQDRNMLSLMMTIDGDEGVGALPVNLYLREALPTDDARQTRFINRDWKRFFKAFGWPTDQDFDPEQHCGDLVGLIGKCKLIQEDYKGEPQNRVVLPKAE